MVAKAQKDTVCPAEFSQPHTLHGNEERGPVEAGQRPALSLYIPSPTQDPVGTNVLAQWVEKESQNSEA